MGDDRPQRDKNNSGFYTEYIGADDKPSQSEANPAGEADKPADYVITPEDLSSLDKIGFTDKITGLMIFNKLKKPEADKLLRIVRGGMTANELGEARKILEESLSEKDMNRLYAILTKNKDLIAADALNVILSGRPPN